MPWLPLSFRLKQATPPQNICSDGHEGEEGLPYSRFRCLFAGSLSMVGEESKEGRRGQDMVVRGLETLTGSVLE
eukprot:748604-Hanusia_phi.AAC.3